MSEFKSCIDVTEQKLTDHLSGHDKTLIILGIIVAAIFSVINIFLRLVGL